ncbi:MAG: winged helix DNA-binding domain-containing protein, partial [Chloroflexota bacterium]|nr:winged helix DNA-binding domain-containing protein [Chloroflexota bacterium]
ILHPTVLVDGRVVGIWKSKQKKEHLDVVVEPFDQLAPEVHSGLEAEVTDIARFLGVNAELQMTTQS